MTNWLLLSKCFSEFLSFNLLEILCRLKCNNGEVTGHFRIIDNGFKLNGRWYVTLLIIYRNKLEKTML